jgi:hypothetical protein
MTSPILEAEWQKARTIRSTWTTAAGAVLLSVAFGAIVPLTQTSRWDEMTTAQQADVDPTSTAMIGVLFTSILFGAMAIRSVTGELGSGMIRTTFLAMPRRGAVLLAKTAIVGGLATSATLLADVVSFLVGQRVLDSVGIGASITAGDSLQAITAGAVAVGLVAVLGVGLGSLLRRTTAATALLTTTLIGGQLVSVAIPEAARPFVPGAALQAAVTVRGGEDLLGPLAAVAVLAAYAAGTLALAVVRIRGRDA